MSLVVSVPLNTMLADLDETLRSMLRRELERHGFDGVEVAFDAPSRDWSSQLSAPTVNMFLYDMRESADRKPTDWSESRGGGRASVARPPMILEATYAVTAWTQDIQDEHRLLSQVLQIFFAYPELPQDVLTGNLKELASKYPLSASIAQPKADGKADFWSAVGGTYKPSLDYVIHCACESGTHYDRGPEVRTHTLRAGIKGGPASTIEEMHRFAGKVLDSGGEPIDNVWVTMPGLGIWTASDRFGHFRFDRLPAGSHELLARTVDGEEAKATVEVPGAKLDLVIGGANGSKPVKSSAKKGSG